MKIKAMRTVIPLCIYFLVSIFPKNSFAQLPTTLFQMTDMEYVGAFRISASTFGMSNMNFSEGPFVYNSANHSIFIVGHDHHQAIAEFSIPTLDTGAITQLPMAINLQPFVAHLNEVNCGNTQNINQIGGLAMINNQLVVNAYEYYDANASVTHTTMILENPGDLSITDVEGFFEFQGGAGHTAGWISPIPNVWQDTLEGSHITGFSSGIPIFSRCSVGPSAFSFEFNNIADSCDQSSIVTHQLLDFSLANPLHSDLSNSSLTNDLWTHLSRATFGMIIPNSRTYMTIGYSGGHSSGVCYKCTQSNNNLCGGYCAPDADDYYQYYWLWDMNDLLAVKAGLLSSHAVRPYDWGPFHTPYENSTKQIGGASFDPSTGILYMSIQRADSEQGRYANPPIIVAYRISAPSCVSNVVLSTPDIYNGMNIFSTDYIQSNATIYSGYQVTWTAGQWIELLPMFEVQSNAVVEMQIGDCSQ